VQFYAQSSLKCTAFAYKDTFLNDQSNLDTQLFEATDFTFIGLACVRDDVREDAGSTIRTLQEALIDIKMITGDTRINAVNVGKQLSMITSEVADGEIDRKSEIL
jgi:Ca2+ transporting ATPase